MASDFLKGKPENWEGKDYSIKPKLPKKPSKLKRFLNKFFSHWLVRGVSILVLFAFLSDVTYYISKGESVVVGFLILQVQNFWVFVSTCGYLV